MMRSVIRFCAVVVIGTVLFGQASFAQQQITGQDYKQDSSKSFSGAYLATRYAVVNDEYQQAARYSYQAYLKNPESRVLQNTALKYTLMQKDFSTAVKLATAHIKMSEEDKKAPNGLAVLTQFTDFILKNQFDKADALIEKHGEESTNLLVRTLLSAWMQSNSYTDAMKTLDSLKDKKAFDIFYNTHKGLIAYRFHKTQEALDSLQTLQDKSASFSYYPLIAYSSLLKEQNHIDKAELVLKDALKQDEDNHFLQQTIGMLGDKDKTLFTFPQNARQGLGQALTDIGVIYAREMDLDTAGCYMLLAEYLNPDNIMTVLSLAEINENSKRSDQAIDFYDKALKLSRHTPFFVNVVLEYAAFLIKEDKSQQAIAFVEQLVAESDDNPVYNNLLGSLYHQVKDYPKAVASFTKIIDTAKASATWENYFSRGISYEQSGQWEKAEQDLQKALELSPDQVEVLNYLGYSWIDRKMNTKKALVLLEKAVSLDPNDAYIIDSLGWAYYHNQDYKKAVEYLEKAVQLMPADPILNEHLGDAFAKVGRDLEATYQWQHALLFAKEQDIQQRISKKLEDEKSRVVMMQKSEL